MMKLSECKASILKSILPKIDQNIIEVCEGEESINISSSNNPVLVLHAALCEFLLVPLNGQYITQFLGDDANIEKLPFVITGAILEKLISKRLKSFSELISTYIEIDSYCEYSEKIKAKYYFDFLLDVEIPKNSNNLNFSEEHIKIPFRLFFKNDTCLNTLIEKIGLLDNLSEFCIDNFKINVNYLVGYQSLTVDELKSIRVGDAIIPRKNFISQKQLFATTGELCFIVDIADDFSELTLLSSPHIILNNREYDMSADNKEGQLDVGKLNLNVQFVLDTVSMSVEDLASLKKGTVVSLNNYNLDNIDILVNEQKIGTGRVVMVNDQYLIQVSELKNNG